MCQDFLKAVASWQEVSSVLFIESRIVFSDRRIHVAACRFCVLLVYGSVKPGSRRFSRRMDVSFRTFRHHNYVTNVRKSMHTFATVVFCTPQCFSVGLCFH